MRFALMIEPQQGLSYDDHVAIARRAEANGFEALFRSDHYAELPGPDRPADDRRLDGPRRARPGHASGSASARSSRRSRSATPATSPRSSTTVDEMSGGRIEVGRRRRLERRSSIDSSACRSRRSRSGPTCSRTSSRSSTACGASPTAGRTTVTSVAIRDAQFHPKPVDVPGRPRTPIGGARPRLLVGGERIATLVPHRRALRRRVQPARRPRTRRVEVSPRSTRPAWRSDATRPRSLARRWPAC